MLMSKTSRNKEILLVLCSCFFIALCSPLDIAAGVMISRPCPVCHHNNMSYGCDRDSGCRTVSVPKGGYCGACRRNLAADEYHLYIYNVDRYFFICNSSQCKNRSFESRKYDYEVAQSKPTTHYTNGVKDYGY